MDEGIQNATQDLRFLNIENATPTQAYFSSDDEHMQDSEDGNANDKMQSQSQNRYLGGYETVNILDDSDCVLAVSPLAHECRSESSGNTLEECESDSSEVPFSETLYNSIQYNFGPYHMPFDTDTEDRNDRSENNSEFSEEVIPAAPRILTDADFQPVLPKQIVVKELSSVELENLRFQSDMECWVEYCDAQKHALDSNDEAVEQDCQRILFEQEEEEKEDLWYTYKTLREQRTGIYEIDVLSDFADAHASLPCIGELYEQDRDDYEAFVNLQLHNDKIETELLEYTVDEHGIPFR